MLMRILTVPVPDNDTSQEILAGAISDKVQSFVLEKVNNNFEEAANIIKSPAFFGICDSFLLKEYLKNTADVANDLKRDGKLSENKFLNLEIYLQIRSDNSVICMIKDDGPGFPESFLRPVEHKGPGFPEGFHGRTQNDPMIDYYDKKVLSDAGKVRQKIISDKSLEVNQEGKSRVKKTKNAKGGAGLGLATGARILRKSNIDPLADELSSMYIGNASELPEKIQKNMPDKTSLHGAAILFEATPYDPKSLENFNDLKTGSLLNKYPNFVKSTERRLENNILGKTNDIDEQLQKAIDRATGKAPTVEEDDDEEKDDNLQINAEKTPPEREHVFSPSFSTAFSRNLNLSVGEEGLDNSDETEISIIPGSLIDLPQPAIEPMPKKRFALDLGADTSDDSIEIDIMNTSTSISSPSTVLAEEKNDTAVLVTINSLDYVDSEQSIFDQVENPANSANIDNSTHKIELDTEPNHKLSPR